MTAVNWPRCANKVLPVPETDEAMNVCFTAFERPERSGYNVAEGSNRVGQFKSQSFKGPVRAAADPHRCATEYWKGWEPSIPAL